MRILTGDECGLLKETIPEKCRPKQKQPQQDQSNNNKQKLSTIDGVHRIDPNESQRRARGVVDLALTNPSKTSYAALRANGSVQLWESRESFKEDFAKYTCTGLVSNVFERSDDEDTQQQAQGRPIALDSLVEQNRLCAADSLGNISILKINTETTPSVVASYSPFAKQSQQTLSYTKGSYTNHNVCSAMAVDTRGERVAIGGRERETRLLDIHTGNVVWKAKNLPPDPQTLLQHPIWSTALAFLSDDNNNTMACGTAFAQVRLYDVRINAKQKRPIAYTPQGLLTHRVTALCQSDQHELTVGDAAGGLFAIDMRNMKNKPKYHLNLSRFVGPVGSIRQVVKHPTLPILAAVGLDRMLRTFDVVKRKQLDCIYMKQRLNAVLFCNDESWSVEDDKNTDVVEDGESGDLNEEDQVQNYVDSSGEEDSSGEGTEDDDSSEGDDSSVDDSEESESESQDDLDEEEAPPRHVSKKRRL